MGYLTRRKFVLTGTAAGLALSALGGPLRALAKDGDKPKIAVGSKDFTESIVLAHIVSLILEDAGFEVERQTNLGGTVVVHEALVHGDVDIYVEYTGTGLLAILGMDLPESLAPVAGATPDADAPEEVGKDPVYDIVAKEYPEQFGLEWLEPWGFNNTYVMAVRGETAEEFGLETISDLEAHAGDMVVGGTQEFLVRPDGLQGLEALYGFGFKDSRGLDPGLVYTAMNEGQVDIISATATDGRIPAMGFVALVDDLGFFPPYYAAPVVRQDLLEAAPEVAGLLNQLAGQITDTQMAELNFSIDDGGAEPIDAARAFLQERNLIDG